MQVNKLKWERRRGFIPLRILLLHVQSPIKVGRSRQGKEFVPLKVGNGAVGGWVHIFVLFGDSSTSNTHFNNFNGSLAISHGDCPHVTFLLSFPCTSSSCGTIILQSPWCSFELIINPSFDYKWKIVSSVFDGHWAVLSCAKHLTGNFNWEVDAELDRHRSISTSCGIWATELTQLV